MSREAGFPVALAVAGDLEVARVGCSGLLGKLRDEFPHRRKRSSAAAGRCSGYGMAGEERRHGFGDAAGVPLL